MTDPNELPAEIRALLEVLVQGESTEVLEVTEELMNELLRSINDDLSTQLSKHFGNRISFARTVTDGSSVTAVTMQGKAMPFIANDEQLNAFLIGMASALQLMKEGGS